MMIFFSTQLLSGCIDSAAPILSGAEPIFGERVQFRFYALRDGTAFDPETVSYRWTGGRYAWSGGGLRDVSTFSAHSFEGDDLIIQSVSVKRPRITEYALARKIADGVYFVIAIDEADADEATRAANCSKSAGVACRIETRDQLIAFARATGAQRHNYGTVALRLAPDKPERPPARRRR